MGCDSSMPDLDVINTSLNEDKQNNYNNQNNKNNNQYTAQSNLNENKVFKSQTKIEQKKQSQSLAQPMPQKQVAIKSNIIKVGQQKNLTVQDRRGQMQLYLNRNVSFITHHLNAQLYLTKYAQASYIKRRQILQHNQIGSYLGNFHGNNASLYTQYALKSYCQRLMVQIFERADYQFFTLHKSIDQVRQKISQRYLFQLYQSKQFVDAALGKCVSFNAQSQTSLSSKAITSDTALYPILKYLKDKYPQVADNSIIKFPQVKEKKIDINLLENFKAKSYATPNYINVQSLFDDLKFLIDKSLQQFYDFQKDMKFLLGDDCLTDSKVKKINKNGMEEYTASPIRRVFIKWTQTIIQRIPDIILSQAFIQFIKSKSKIADNFYFKSTVQPTTHVKVIQFLCNLLQTAKYQTNSQQRNKNFGFYIYDLLRCKTKRKTGQQICQLLQKMQSTTITPSGKRFEVTRIKNRFKTPNRDLMVNFRYGQVLVAQAQLCIDMSDVSEKTQKINKFNHYIYQLQRGLFGPTFQLMMQYEDFSRKDISANLRAQGRVFERKPTKNKHNQRRKVDKKCMNGHEMIELKGNYFIMNHQGIYDDQLQICCDYCIRVSSTSQPYHYCYFCSIMLCPYCEVQYKKLKTGDLQIHCQIKNLLKPLTNQLQLSQKMKQCPIVIFYLQGKSSSLLLLDFWRYLISSKKFDKKPLPPIYCFSCSSSTPICQTLQLQQFPTTIVFNRQGIPQTKIIGALWCLTDGLIETHYKLIKGQNKSIAINCICGAQCSQVNNQEQEKFYCVNCGNSEKDEDDRSKYFVCESMHKRCMYCSFFGVNQPSTFKDYRGSTYLQDKLVKVQLDKCRKGHNMTYTHHMDDNKEPICISCSKNFIFNDELGVGHCVQCNDFTCQQCIGLTQATMKQCQSQLINHTIQSTAQQTQICGCKRMFKKVYNTRDYYSNQIQQDDQNKLNKMISSVYKKTDKQWICLLCMRTRKQGELHLACFRCNSVADLKTNCQLCIDCAIGTDMMNKLLEERIIQVATSFQCKKGKHPIIRTTQSYNQDEMMFDCLGCTKKFYIYTQHFHCKQCNTNVCLYCSAKHLTQTNPPKCLRKCTAIQKQKHELVLKQKVDQLQMCEICQIVIRKRHFMCKRECNFRICLKCAQTKEDVKIINPKMRHASQKDILQRREQFFGKFRIQQDQKNQQNQQEQQQQSQQEVELQIEWGQQNQVQQNQY